jgi:hypothetical protein
MRIAAKTANVLETVNEWIGHSIMGVTLLIDL